MSESTEKGSKQNIIKPEAASAGGSTIDPTVWISENFAQKWFADALHEAQSGKDFDSTRREIVFAVCFIESYIFEWVRSIVQLEEINKYFPPKSNRKLKEKWKEIPGELYNNNKIKMNPKLDLSKLGLLIKYRNGLVHAKASRPTTDIQPEETKPCPTRNLLNKLGHGWAVDIAVDLVVQLHNALGSSIPNYIKKP